MKKYAFTLLLFVPFLAGAQSRAEWYVPDHLKLQFAGNIGFISIGAGYLHGNGHLETDVFLGYLPKSIGGDDILSLTSKLTYSPWSLPLSSRYTVIPFSAGPYLSYSFGSQFDTFLPNEYPEGYYWWASSLRLGAFIGGRLKMALPATRAFSHISLYYELSSYDLLMISLVQNTGYLGISDIFSLSLGLKIDF